MEELASYHPRSDHVCERQYCGRTAGLPEERPRCFEGTERVRDLLLRHLDGHADSEQAMRHLQEHIPLGVSVPVVQEQ